MFKSVGVNLPTIVVKQQKSKIITSQNAQIKTPSAKNHGVLLNHTKFYSLNDNENIYSCSGVAMVK